MEECKYMMDMKHTGECSSILESHIRNINIYPSKFNCSVQSVLQPAPRLTNVVCIFRLSSLIIYRLILSIKFVKYMTKYARNRLYIYIYIYKERENCVRFVHAKNPVYSLYSLDTSVKLFFYNVCLCKWNDFVLLHL